MKVLEFTIPVIHDKSVTVKEEIMPYFYPYLHRHVEVQLTWIQQGKGTLIVGNSMYPFEPGNIFLLGADLPHVFKSSPEYFNEDSGMNIRALNVFFKPDSKLAALFDLPEMKMYESFFKLHSGGFKLPHEPFEKITKTMNRVKSTEGLDQLMGFFYLMKQLHGIKNPSPLSLVHAEKISESEGIKMRAIYNYIFNRYHTNIMLEEVAAMAFMTPQAFCRYFKKNTGNTFVTFLNEMRINEACKKFTSGKYENISTVGYTCGFNSITNFNRVFKSVTGKSPKVYIDTYFKKLSGVKYGGY